MKELLQAKVLATAVKISKNEINKKVSKLSEDISQGKGAVKVLMALGALVVGILGYLNIK